FEFKSKSIAAFECIIINRWGIQVGELNDINDGWDGTDMNGDPCKDGVYFYKFVATADNGETIKRQGTIQIVGIK
ncbi:MAG: flagellar hook assembly protein FlgD, partial [Crocinitomix sp.]